MAIKKYKPTSPGRRFFTGSTFEELTANQPEKSLLAPLKKSAGRNSYGRITVRHRGGGHKRRFRVIDFKREKDDIQARWPVLSMIQIARPALHCSIMLMERSAIFCPRVCRLVKC